MSSFESKYLDHTVFLLRSCLSSLDRKNLFLLTAESVWLLGLQLNVYNKVIIVVCSERNFYFSCLNYLCSWGEEGRGRE